MKTFEAMGLSEALAKALKQMGIETPSQIQQEVIPNLLSNPHQDLIGLAQTGTGKTAAFGIPLIEHIDTSSREVQALVLSPTRELGQQIATQFDDFGKYTRGLKTVAVYGGANISNQIREIKKGPQIIIATPGRLIDLLERKAISLKQIQHLVLDEADEMLNMGFKEDIDKILTYTQGQRNTWLFSATMPPEIKRIVNEYMDKNALEVRVNQNAEVNANIEHQYLIINRDNKYSVLTSYLSAHHNMSSIIFCRTRAAAQKLGDDLYKSGFRADALHGELSQKQRDRVMEKFKKRELDILVATDVAARGIDVKDLSHVIHYNLPDQFEYYTHRSGRTARAGQKGISIAFIFKSDMRKISSIEKQLKVKFVETDLPDLSESRAKAAQIWATELKNTKPKKIDAVLLYAVTEILSDVSKEELIAKLVADRFSFEEKPSAPKRERNERSDDRRKDSSRSRNDDSRDRRRDDRREDKRDDRRSDRRDDRRSEKPDKKASGMTRFYFNFGAKSGVTKKDLLDFICEETKVDRGDIGSVFIDNQSSSFDIRTEFQDKVNKNFKNIVVDGRDLKVTKSDLSKNSGKRDKYSNKGKREKRR